MMKRLVVATMAASLFLVGCAGEPGPRTQDSTDKKSVEISKDVVRVGFPYVTGGGNMNGATSNGGQPGFDQAGFISYVLAECCTLAAGDSVVEIYDNTLAPEWDEGVAHDPIPGDLVFTKAKDSVGIIVSQDDDEWTMALANKETGLVEEIPWDKEKYPTIRVIDDSRDGGLRGKYFDWHERNQEDSSNVNPNEYIDPNDQKNNELVIPE